MGEKENVYDEKHHMTLEEAVYIGVAGGAETMEELKEFGYDYDYCRERYLRFHRSQISRAVDIAKLYYMRGNKKEVEYYLSFVDNPLIVNDFWRGVTHP